jgi:hypothetical protein
MYKYIKCHFCNNVFWGTTEKEDTCDNCLKKYANFKATRAISKIKYCKKMGKT